MYYISSKTRYYIVFINFYLDLVYLYAIISSMTRGNRSKINLLLRRTQKGVPLTMTWLQQQDISYKLAWWYVKSGWLEHITDGLYRFAEDKITWAGAVAAIQQQLNLPIYPGGKTALQLLGKSHYVSKELQTIQLFVLSPTKSPKWLYIPCWDESIFLYRATLFTKNNLEWLTQITIDGCSLSISSPEKASLELCSLVPKTVTFEEAALIIENLPRMRPKLLQSLLEDCRSYKAKRLLLYLGDYFQHSWINEINLQKVDLGKGKRVIAGGGHYNAKYQISIPLLEEGK
jgi:hypothetical protein